MPTRTANRDDRKTFPIPIENAKINLDLRFSIDELDHIKRGVLPREMEDKWFVYWQEDRLYFHRSWTGFCVYVLDFVEEPGGARVVSADANRDPDQWKEIDGLLDRDLIPFLVEVLLLRNPTAPLRADLPPEKAALLRWSLVGRAGLGEYPDPENDHFFVIKSRCYLCVHKFKGLPGCDAFPNGLPGPIASGQVMHWPDRPFPGDKGIRFELNPDFRGKLTEKVMRELDKAGVLNGPNE